MEYERFAPLVAAYTADMGRVAAALVGSADAEDAAQEALLRAWRGWSSLREAGATRPWLLRITVNVCRNWQAGHFGTHRRRTEALGPQHEVLPLAGHAPLGTAEHAGALDLRRAVATLPPDLLYVVALRFYVGLDATEIGAILELPPATVRTRLRRALHVLRAALADTDPSLPALREGRGR
ncbi:MAG: RNA polymerase sigma factor [Ktedonobacterales bacterium]